MSDIKEASFEEKRASSGSYDKTQNTRWLRHLDFIPIIRPMLVFLKQKTHDSPKTICEADFLIVHVIGSLSLSPSQNAT